MFSVAPTCVRTCSGTATPTCSRATEHWPGLETPTGDLFAWDAWSTYIKNPPYFDDIAGGPKPILQHVLRQLAAQG